VKRVTAPRKWPTDAKRSRDEAAEEIVAALRDMEEDAEKSHKVAKAMIHIQKALRWLESQGAATKP
jgi:hypothetical protein